MKRNHDCIPYLFPFYKYFLFTLINYFDITIDKTELKTMSGGRGLQLIKLEDKDALAGAAAYTRSVRITGVGRGGKAKEESLEIRSLNTALGKRGSKGKATGWTFKPNGIFRVE